MMLVSKKFLAVTAFGVAATMTLGSCGKDPDGTEYAVVTGEATSCFMGTVTDAFSGGRVDLASAEIWAVMNGAVYPGAMTNGGDKFKANIAGDYFICGVPNASSNGTTVSLPVHFKVPGYQERIYTVAASAAEPDRNLNTSEPGYWSTPTVVQNAEVYKLADLVSKDFVVNVNSKGAALADASVWLRPSTASGSTAVANLTGKTDASGNATFAASTLAFGATYTLTVVPKSPIAADGSYVAASFTGTAIIGGAQTVSGATLKSSNPFNISVDMADAATSAPKLLSQTSGNTVTSSGTVILLFDRAVTYEAVSALVAGGTSVAIGSNGTKSDNTACLATDIGSPVLDATRSVSVSVSGSTATITPNWTTAPTNFSTCGGITLVYTLNSLDFYSKSAVIPAAVQPANVTVYVTAPIQAP